MHCGAARYLVTVLRLIWVWRASSRKAELYSTVKSRLVGLQQLMIDLAARAILAQRAKQDKMFPVHAVSGTARAADVVMEHLGETEMTEIIEDTAMTIATDIEEMALKARV